MISPQQKKAITDGIERFLRERCFAEGEPIPPDENLFLSGRLSSFEMIELVLFIESEFSVTIDPLKITVENLGSLNSITAFLVDLVEL